MKNVKPVQNLESETEPAEEADPLKPVSVDNLRWADPEKTGFIADITLSGGNTFSALVRDGDLPHVQAVWDDAIAKKLGPIADFVAAPEPTEEEARALMPTLERWQFNAIIDLHSGLREKIVAGLTDLPEPRRTIALCKFQDKQTFERRDSLMIEITSLPDNVLTASELDKMWQNAPL